MTGTVIFRCNVSASVGLGHLMRCREMARYLGALGWHSVLLGPPDSLRQPADEGLFAGWRYRSPDSREENPDFVLNRPACRQASILIAGRNFGCGSSREHAVWALHEFGIRAVIAKSFSEIFHGNCIRNGLLPVALDGSAHAVMLDMAGDCSQRAEIVIDLTRQEIRTGEDEFVTGFTVDASHRHRLLNGLDPIALTMEWRDEIDAFVESDRTRRPWIYR